MTIKAVTTISRVAHAPSTRPPDSYVHPNNNGNGMQIALRATVGLSEARFGSSQALPAAFFEAINAYRSFKRTLIEKRP